MIFVIVLIIDEALVADSYIHMLRLT